MKAISGKDFCRVLEQRGWSLLRVNGSHHIYGKLGVTLRLSVPVHGNDALKTGLLRYLMKLAQLTESDLRKSPSITNRCTHNLAYSRH